MIGITHLAFFLPFRPLRNLIFFFFTGIEHHALRGKESTMLSEEFVSAICGAPLSSNTAITKDVGIYCHTLSPTYSVKSTFKKSSAPARCLAVSDTHVFAAQHEKAYVHVYSRIRGNQEAFVAFPERIRCVTLVGNVLIMGTAEGRVMLWEVRLPYQRCRAPRC